MNCERGSSTPFACYTFLTNLTKLVVDFMSLLCDNCSIEAKERKVTIFVTSSGKVPYDDWFDSLRDKRAQAIVFNRIDRVRLGNFGNCRSVGGGVYELKIYYGPGLRVYFGLDGEEIVLLLCGGDKSSQKKDIAHAHELWKEHKKHAN